MLRDRRIIVQLCATHKKKTFCDFARPKTNNLPLCVIQKSYVRAIRNENGFVVTLCDRNNLRDLICCNFERLMFRLCATHVAILRDSFHEFTRHFFSYVATLRDPCWDIALIMLRLCTTQAFCESTQFRSEKIHSGDPLWSQNESRTADPVTGSLLLWVYPKAWNKKFKSDFWSRRSNNLGFNLPRRMALRLQFELKKTFQIH